MKNTYSLILFSSLLLFHTNVFGQPTTAEIKKNKIKKITLTIPSNPDFKQETFYNRNGNEMGMLREGKMMRYYKYSFDTQLRPLSKKEFLEDSTLWIHSTYTYNADGSYTELHSNFVAGQTLVHTFQYDSSGRLLKATLSDGSTDEKTYDDKGNEVTLTKGRGPGNKTVEKTVNSYNKSNQLTGKLFHDGRKLEYTYDANGLVSEIKIINGSKTTIHQYQYEIAK